MTTQIRATKEVEDETEREESVEVVAGSKLDSLISADEIHGGVLKRSQGRGKEVRIPKYARVNEERDRCRDQTSGKRNLLSLVSLSRVRDAEGNVGVEALKESKVLGSRRLSLSTDGDDYNGVRTSATDASDGLDEVPLGGVNGSHDHSHVTCRDGWFSRYRCGPIEEVDHGVNENASVPKAEDRQESDVGVYA